MTITDGSLIERQTGALPADVVVSSRDSMDVYRWGLRRESWRRLRARRSSTMITRATLAAIGADMETNR